MENRGWRPNIPAKRKTAQRKRKTLYGRKKRTIASVTISVSVERYRRKKRDPYADGRNTKCAAYYWYNRLFTFTSFLFATNLDTGHSGSSSIPDYTSQLYISTEFTGKWWTVHLLIVLNRDSLRSVWLSCREEGDLTSTMYKTCLHTDKSVWKTGKDCQRLSSSSYCTYLSLHTHLFLSN